jgi:hypothetical protein
LRRLGAALASTRLPRELVLVAREEGASDTLQACIAETVLLTEAPPTQADIGTDGFEASLAGLFLFEALHGAPDKPLTGSGHLGANAGLRRLAVFSMVTATFTGL